MRITSIQLHNVVCYRGRQTLNLEAKAYAIVARAKDDPRRSNWLGKSALLDAVWFALYGEHRWATEDSWITHGEDEGGVKLTFDNGMTVERSRVRGHANKLLVGQAKGDEAQTLIEEAVGLDKEDSKATWYFPQKCMSRFVVAKPAERMDIVVGWLRLEKLEGCIDKASAALGRTVEGVSVYQARLANSRAAIDELLRANLPLLDPQSTNRQISEAMAIARREWDAERERLAGSVGRLEDDYQKVATWQAGAGAAASYAEIVSEGTELKAWLAEADLLERRKARDVAVKLTAEALAVSNAARRELATKEALVRGKFDGKCPVAGIPCPAKDSINAGMSVNTGLHAKAQEALRTAKAAYDAAKVQSDEALRLVREAEDVETRLGVLREQVSRHKNTANRFAAGCPVPNPDDIPVKLSGARARLAEVTHSIRAIDAAVVRFNQLIEENAKTVRHVESLQREGGLRREEQLVFRRARQRIAERALHDIEGGANALLQESGIDLSLAARWQREGGGMADNCDACGTPFGRSLKVKVCPRCGEARGPKMVNKLELVLSNVSGAAEDLGGGAFQLSASAWLRNARGCGWSVALIDEPFGALDEANRDAFATHLATMLSGQYGFEQSFIVAHNPAAMDALPGRIEVVSEGGFSVARVVA